MLHVCSYTRGLCAEGHRVPTKAATGSFCSRLGRYPIGFGPVHLMKALCKWVHLMIQLNMIKKNKATHVHALSPPLSLYFPLVTHTLHYPGPFPLPTSMPVCAAICADVWLSSRGRQHTQSPIICSKPNVHNPRAGLTPRLPTNTHQHSERLIHGDVTREPTPGMNAER